MPLVRRGGELVRQSVSVVRRDRSRAATGDEGRRRADAGHLARRGGRRRAFLRRLLLTEFRSRRRGTMVDGACNNGGAICAAVLGALPEAVASSIRDYLQAGSPSPAVETVGFVEFMPMPQITPVNCVCVFVAVQ